MVATALGVWSLLFLLSWLFGVVDSFISKSVDYRLGHIQIHHSEYGKEFQIQNSFDLRSVISKVKEAESHSPRIVVQAMVASVLGNGGLIIKGVDPELEQSFSKISTTIKEGHWFETKKKNSLVISTRTADQLSLELGDKLVAQFQDAQGALTSAAFKVVGIFESGDIKLDALTAFARLNDMDRLVKLPNGHVHELLAKIGDIDQVDQVKAEWQKRLPDALIQTYFDISPDIRLFSTQIKLNVVIMTIIFMLALVFGIINTMLMAVLERVKELGMLMAIGMNRKKIYRMIIWETFLLTMAGVPVGLLLGYLTIYNLSIEGVDLANWSEGLRQFGLPQVVKPQLDWGYYVWVSISVAVTSILAALYPSYKAIGLEPVEALRKV